MIYSLELHNSYKSLILFYHMAMGVFSDKGLKKLIDEGIVYVGEAEKEISDEQIQPSSLDLRIGRIGFCMPYSAFPSKGSLADFLKSKSHYNFSVADNGFLHRRNCSVRY